MMQLTGLPGIATSGKGVFFKELNPPRCAEYIIGIDCDDDGGSREDAQHLARRLITEFPDCTVRLATPVKSEDKKGYDWNDALIAAGTDDHKKLGQLILNAPTFEANGEEVGGTAADRINALAMLDAVVYDQQRKQAAKQLGIRSKVLDQEVAKCRTEQLDQVGLYPHWTVEPAAESIDTGQLLQAITKQINRYVATLGNRAIVPALFVMNTWVHEQATHSPLLIATSAEPDSGKTTLVGVMSFLSYRALLSVNISGPVLFRSIEKWQPTFTIDEADTALADNTDLKAVVNSGWTRGQAVIRCDPETHEPRAYSTFAPKILAMKKDGGRVKLPDTTISRAIVIELKRKTGSESVADFDHNDNEDLARLRCQLLMTMPTVCIRRIRKRFLASTIVCG
jgi:hypothetical protein